MGTSLQSRKDTASVGSPVDAGDLLCRCVMCEVASDWPLQTCNIILHVSAPSIGYTGPALHQAVALDGNRISTNT